MRKLIAGGLACFLVVLSVPAVRADGPPDPLRAIPAGAEWVFRVEDPRRIIETILQLDVINEFQKIETFREAYETTNARRFYQFVAYLEKELGHPYAELIDRLAGGGVAVSATFADKQPQFLVAVQAKDNALLQRFAKLATDIAEQELARLEIKERQKTKTYRDVQVTHVTKNVFAALKDGTLLVSTSDKMLKKAVDTLLDGKGSVLGAGTLTEARKGVAGRPLAWTWLNLEAVRSIPEVKAGFDMFSLDPNFLFVFGGMIDVSKRAPYVAAGVYQDKNQFTLSLRLPSGSDGMKASAMLTPADGAGSLPLLEPANVLGSLSYFLDLGKFWEHRAQIFNEGQLKTLEDLDKQSGAFLGGVKLGQLLTQAGPHQRVVVVQQTKPGYKIKPKQAIPAFAAVLSMRDEGFGKNMETVLRAVALLGSFQADLKMIEEKRGDVTLVGYRFPEEGDSKFGPDYQTLQYNFSPCFANVGKQFIISSTMELGRELIDIVSKESATKASPATTRLRLYSTGGADIMRTNHDFLLTQFVLSQALEPKAARQQLDQLIQLVERLGVADFDIEYGPREARVDVRVKLGK